MRRPPPDRPHAPAPAADRLLRAILLALLAGLFVGLLVGVRVVLAQPAPGAAPAADTPAPGARGAPPPGPLPRRALFGAQLAPVPDSLRARLGLAPTRPRSARATCSWPWATRA
jgi:hypothetical protein